MLTQRDIDALPRWVAWKPPPDPKTGRKRKLPINPKTGRAARTDDPLTWGTRAQAERRRLDGVGVVLGALDDGPTLCGVDLDNCFDGHAPTPWARVVLDRLGADAEVSPSGRGIKAFWFADDVSAFGKAKRLDFMRGEHEAVQVHRDGYYTVTGRRFGEAREPASIDPAALRWLIHEHGPSIARGRARRPGLRLDSSSCATVSTKGRTSTPRAMRSCPMRARLANGRAASTNGSVSGPGRDGRFDRPGRHAEGRATGELPPPRLSLLEWAESAITLPDTVSAFPGRLWLYPFQRGVADAIGDPAVERVTLVKSVRVGPTTLLPSAVACYLANDTNGIKH